MPAVMLIVPAPAKVYCELLAPPPRLRVDPAFDVIVVRALFAKPRAEFMVAVLLAATVMLPFVALAVVTKTVPPVS